MKKIFTFFTVWFLVSCSSEVVVNPPSKLTEIKNPINIKTNWRKGIGSSDNRQLLKISPSFKDDRVYTVDKNGEINVFSTTGSRLYSKHINAQASSISANKNIFIVTTIKGEILAYLTNDFSLKWTKKLNAEVLVKALFVEDKVLIRTTTGKVIALSIFDGSEQWTYEQLMPTLSSRGSSEMILSDHKVIIGFDSGILAVINPINGTAFWEKQVSKKRGLTELDRINDLDNKLVIDSGFIYFIGQDGYLNKYNIQTAQRVWRIKQNSNVGLVSNKDLLFIIAKDSSVIALSKDTGIEVWKQKKLLYRDLTAPLLYNNNLIIGDIEGYVHVLSVNTGKLIGRALVDEYGIKAQPLAYKKQFFIQSFGSYLTAFSI